MGSFMPRPPISIRQEAGRRGRGQIPSECFGKVENLLDKSFLFQTYIRNSQYKVKKCEERENQQDATIRCLLSTSEQCSHPTTQCPTTATNHIQQNQRSTPYALTHGLCYPEDRHNDARNMLRQKLIINIRGEIYLYNVIIQI